MELRMARGRNARNPGNSWLAVGDKGLAGESGEVPRG